MMHHPHKALFLTSALGILSLQSPGIAANYSAICTCGTECSVLLGVGKISMPGLTINKDKVLSWSQGGSGTKTDVGIGVASVVMFGLPGLIGFGAKKHDYLYSINYVDEAGNTQATTVGFKNNVPANQFMNELMGMTGLSMGETNKTLQEQIDSLQAAAAEKARLAALQCAPVLKPYKCSWSQYLDANASVRAWAQKYPQMATAEKTRLLAADMALYQSQQQQAVFSW